MPPYRFETITIQTTEQDVAEMLGMDYDEILRQRADLEKLDPEVRAALDDLRRETSREFTRQMIFGG